MVGGASHGLGASTLVGISITKHICLGGVGLDLTTSMTTSLFNSLGVHVTPNWVSDELMVLIVSS